MDQGIIGTPELLGRDAGISRDLFSWMGWMAVSDSSRRVTFTSILSCIVIFNGGQG